MSFGCSQLNYQVVVVVGVFHGFIVSLFFTYGCVCSSCGLFRKVKYAIRLFVIRNVIITWAKAMQSKAPEYIYFT
eukprot:gene7695-5397_t